MGVRSSDLAALKDDYRRSRMHNDRPDFPDNVHRLVSLDERDVEDLHRLLGKLREPLGSGPQDTERPNHDEVGLEQRARRLLENRRKRVAIFGAQMFAEPAWEMLLLLYLSGRGRRQTQSNLCEMSGASRSTAIRWIEFLATRDLVRREEHPTDKRQNFVSLTEKGRHLFDLYLSETG